MTAIVYSDASYSYKQDISACGFCVLVDGALVKHQVQLISGIGATHKAEIFALVCAIQFAFLLNGVTEIKAYTDYLSVITRKSKKLIYRDLDETLGMCLENGITVTIDHVKAHSGDEFNTLVDKSCHSNLKKYLYGKQKKRKGAYNNRPGYHYLNRDGRGIPKPKQ